MSHTHTHRVHHHQAVTKYVPYHPHERETKGIPTSNFSSSTASSTSSALRKHFGKAVAQVEARVERDRTKPMQQCEHIDRLKKYGGMGIYSRMINTFVYPVNQKAKDLRDRICKCGICQSTTGLQTCLHCIHFGCAKRGHMRNHFLKTGHTIVANIDNGATFCFRCCDVFFDRDFEFIADHIKKGLRWELALPVVARLPQALAYDQKFKRIFSKPISTSQLSTLGIRGLINLGHTCFMSCIVQSLIHTPMLRDYFSAKKIVCEEKHDVNSQKPCIVSLVGDLYQEFYNGSKAPVSLHGLLFKIWGNASHLAGYEQQDAHEFFIAMLDALHLHFHNPGPTGVCRCVIDIIFLGRLQSAVSCMVCGHKSITVDPFWDTSLDLTNDQTGVTLKLEDCLNRYTRLEHLGSSEMIWCTKCKGNQMSTKQLKFQTLPMVLCLHLKRFEHRTSYKKIDTRVEFPECLYMNEYTSEFNITPKMAPGSNGLVHHNKKDDYKYSLYAVVNHVGSLDGGHYYAFIRHAGSKNWFKCDDHWVTRASQADVLSSPGYLLFYHKEVLYYDSMSTKPLHPKKRSSYISSKKGR